MNFLLVIMIIYLKCLCSFGWECEKCKRVRFTQFCVLFSNLFKVVLVDITFILSSKSTHLQKEKYFKFVPTLVICSSCTIRRIFSIFWIWVEKYFFMVNNFDFWFLLYNAISVKMHLASNFSSSGKCILLTEYYDYQSIIK